ncbi:uncharacterized protein LOC130656383 [Hydractinia symbiolongicarpus]|uniref:uncharacterized protein LOC130656383 n=1 Tax=Hydractinia symbiolongicarpus TaxID=13093 RepID=UPI002550AF96|nr:uncharacterized protein LOC130656383 [Hydractinia symbiolongicarpus]XP_057315211.1 uncharacterized protein LOC130656383 [Hydractinia symbiolongicarpus]XP_057315212.1 uncharacterized protein LOC130656383 [Hydractinia symbiolongicarpus]XP_057315213.1 uncharacterized protein LOC130656383 [Hydractinia symbiolongicarpus]
MPKNENEHVELLFCLKPVYNFVDFQIQCMESSKKNLEDTNLLSDLSDISKEHHVFVQPYSIKPKKHKRTPINNNIIKKRNYLKKCITKKVGIQNQKCDSFSDSHLLCSNFEKPPASPSLSIDSAIDLSHDMFVDVSEQGNLRPTFDFSDAEQVDTFSDYSDLCAQDETGTGDDSGNVIDEFKKLKNQCHKFYHKACAMKGVNINKEHRKDLQGAKNVKITNTQKDLENNEHPLTVISVPKISGFKELQECKLCKISLQCILKVSSIPIIVRKAYPSCQVVLKDVLKGNGRSKKILCCGNKIKLMEEKSPDTLKLTTKKFEESKVLVKDYSLNKISEGQCIKQHSSPVTKSNVEQEKIFNDIVEEFVEKQSIEYRRPLNILNPVSRDIFPVSVHHGMAIRTTRMIVHDEDETMPHIFLKSTEEMDKKNIEPHEISINTKEMEIDKSKNLLSDSIDSTHSKEISTENNFLGSLPQNKKIPNYTPNNFVIGLLHSTSVGLLNKYKMDSVSEEFLGSAENMDNTVGVNPNKSSLISTLFVAERSKSFHGNTRESKNQRFANSGLKLSKSCKRRCDSFATETDDGSSSDWNSRPEFANNSNSAKTGLNVSKRFRYASTNMFGKLI